jgi:hypothetical protein
LLRLSEELKEGSLRDVKQPLALIAVAIAQMLDPSKL